MAAAPAPGKGNPARGARPPGNRSADSAVSERDRSPSGRAVSFARPRGSGAAAARGQLGTRGPDGAALQPTPRPPRPADRSPTSLGARTARVPSPCGRCSHMASGILVPGPGMGTHPLCSESRKS
ncbi:unnamed protein product [Rangifer tarandus platyrhynchus]|uniref:Uncharacterized protein n=1 Tax=Rangifer tarandus platyrhynchus TaxID=3082113 RepID=A0AC60A9N5_RANTA